jgi:hypothetical protein
MSHADGSNQSDAPARGYLVDPYKAEVQPIEIPIDDFKEIQRQLGCSCFTTGGYLANGDVIFVDDEGLLNGPTHFFRIKNVNGGQPLAGRGVVLGSDGEGGSADVKTSLEEITSLVRWVYAMDRRGEVLFDVSAAARGQAARTEIVVV